MRFSPLSIVNRTKADLSGNIATSRRLGDKRMSILVTTISLSLSRHIDEYAKPLTKLTAVKGLVEMARESPEEPP